MPLLSRLSNGCELVDATQRGVVVGGGQLGADAPYANGRSLILQAGNDVLVEVIGSEDPRLLETGVVEQLSRFDAEVRQIARIQSDAEQFVTVVAQPSTDLY